MYRKKERCQRSTNKSFDSKGTPPQLQNRLKGLSTHSNKGQLQSGTGRSTNKVTKQDVSQENRFYKNVPRLCPNTLQQTASPTTIQTSLLLQTRCNKQGMKSLGQQDLNTHIRGLFRKGKCPYQKDLYPYLSSRPLSSLLISILRQ